VVPIADGFVRLSEQMFALHHSMGHMNQHIAGLWQA
jgi:hypothetical protein